MKLKDYRKQKHLTQMQLAKLLDIDDTTVSKLESGTVQPSMALLQKIMKVTNKAVTAEEFF